MNVHPSSAPAQASRVKGPIVWLDMDQKALDDAYDQVVYAPNRDFVHARNVFNGKRVRERLGEPKRIAYGPTPIEAYDLFPAKQPNAPINVFIHGGAWRQRSAKDYHFIAETYVRAGAHCVVLDFAGVENTGGDLLPMADQVTRAIVQVHKNAASFGGDASRLYISGQSSGAHLAGVMSVTDWTQHGLPRDAIKGALLCSGMFDLKPVRLSKRSQYVNFTDEVEEKLSSQRHLDRLHCPLIVAYGTCETPEFQRQSRDFAGAVKAAGKPVQLLVGEGYNHFEMPEMLASPYSQLGAAALDQMNLTPG